MKKYIKNTKLLILVAGMSFLTSCEDFEELAVNPNSINTPVTSALLTNALLDFDTPASNGGLLGGLYCQYFSETQYTESSLYSLPQISWDGTYAGSLFDLQSIIDNNTAEETKAYAGLNGSNNNQIALARILKAYRYLNLTDSFGDIPYSEALLQSANISPKYDSQQEVYNGLFKELKEAIAQFDGGAVPKGDIVYNGDLTKWKKFANSLRLIMALRLSKVDPATGKTQFLDALASNSGVIESNDDNTQVVYPGGTYKNPWFELYDGRKDYAISETIGHLLEDTNDLRAKAFGQTNSSGALVSFPYGLTRDDAVDFASSNANYSFILSADKRAATSASYILTAGHVYLARAEAAQLGWTTESAADMYKEGIAASWNQWGVFDQAKFDAFIASDAISLATEPLAKIQNQRYLAFYPNGSMGWAEWRRTGVPVLVPTPNATNSSKQIPRRYVYGSNEPILNKVSYSAAVAKTPDNENSKVWWDK
jgi:Starch-binding associating with outer membrane